MILSTEPGAHVASVATSFPANVAERDAVAEALARAFPDEDAAFVHQLVERSGVETRHIVPSVAEALAPSSFTERNLRYRDAAGELARSAASLALERARLAPEEVDVLIDVSCTGIAIPALDVDLVPALGLRSDARRLPITESGCAAGALGLSIAASFAQTGQRVLLVAVELCSLTFCKSDRSRTNLIASILFGDGAAAAVVTPGGPGPRFEATASHLIPETRNTMGFDVGEHGLRILLKRELPSILGGHLEAVVDGFLKEHGRTREDVGLHLVHPGGRRILEGYGRLFALEAEDLRFSRESLRRYGNLSSASILSVFELAAREGVELAEGREVLLVGVGPGLSLELALLSGSFGDVGV